MTSIKDELTMINKIDQWLDDLNYIYLVNYDDDEISNSKEEQSGLQRALNSYKKKLVQLENEVKRIFRFPKNIVDIINEHWKTNGEFGYYGKAIYIDGKNDMRITYKNGLWRLTYFGFGWICGESGEVHGGWIENDKYELEVPYDVMGGHDYNGALDALKNSDNFLKTSLLFLKDILTKPHKTLWEMDR